MNKKLAIILPIVVLILGILGAFLLVKSRAEVKTEHNTPPPPLVRVMTVEKQHVPLLVHSQGTVNPRTESLLISQVAGQILSVSPNFAAGGFFEKDEVLVQIDPRDYELAVERARARVAQAKVALMREEQEAAIAREEWELIGEGKPSPLVVREPQLNEAKASLAAAEADLRQAELNLERTKIRAPYAGLVRAKNVDVGQYVAPGAVVARIFAIDYAEVRLPLPDEQLAYLDLDFSYRGQSEYENGPEVILSADFAGRTHRWTGRIVRIESEVNQQTQMVHLVARVKNPYDRSDDPQRPPLTAGLFVKAEIQGRTAKDVVVVPREAVRNRDEVLIVDANNKLYRRDVEIVRTTTHEVIIHNGLEDGEQVCLSPMNAVSDGMDVRIIDESDNGGETS